MTTSVTVKANHGWPVKVSGIDPKTGNKLENWPEQTVEKDTERTFHVHSTMDLVIHEVQPDEVAQTAAEQGSEGTDEAQSDVDA